MTATDADKADGACDKSSDGKHCPHWWDGDKPCCRCGYDGGDPGDIITDADKAAARWVQASVRAGYALPMSDDVRATLDAWQGEQMEHETTLTLMLGGEVRMRDYLEARAREVLDGDS